MPWSYFGTIIMHTITPALRNCFLFVVLLSCMLSALLPAGSATLALPPASSTNLLLSVPVVEMPSAKWQVECSGAAAGLNNVGSLWTLSDDNQPARHLGESSPYALLQSGEWTRLTHHQWVVAYGRGISDCYTGNRDAGQFWLDLHAKTPLQSSYHPLAENVYVSMNWYGVGRQFQFAHHKVHGTAEILLRMLDADNVRIRTVTGDVLDDNYSGMVKFITTGDNHVHGSGWALDTNLRVELGQHWTAEAAVEGLLGELHWKNLKVTDGYIMSPRVFEDPDGYLNDISGTVTGATYPAELQWKLSPVYRVNLMTRQAPHILLGVTQQEVIGTVPSVGYAYHIGKQWLSAVRVYPTQRQLEFGIYGKGWQFTLAGDDWIFASPKRARFNVTVPTLAF